MKNKKDPNIINVKKAVYDTGDALNRIDLLQETFPDPDYVLEYAKDKDIAFLKKLTSLLPDDVPVSFQEISEKAYKFTDVKHWVVLSPILRRLWRAGKVRRYVCGKWGGKGKLKKVNGGRWWGVHYLLSNIEFNLEKYRNSDEKPEYDTDFD